MEILMQAMNDHVKSLLKDGGVLYRVNVTGEQLWDAYMQGFENDPVFRDPNSSVHNCNDCKHFIHRYANLVVLKDFEFKSIYYLLNQYLIFLFLKLKKKSMKKVLLLC